MQVDTYKQNGETEYRDVLGSIFLPSTRYWVMRRFFAESGYRVPAI